MMTNIYREEAKKLQNVFKEIGEIKYGDGKEELLNYPILITLKDGLTQYKGYTLVCFKSIKGKEDEESNKQTTIYFYYIFGERGSSPFGLEINYTKGEKLKKDQTDWINFGHTVGTNNSFELSSEELVHYGIIGGPGSGKSVLLVNILKQYLENGNEMVIVEKETDYLGLLEEFSDQILFHGNLEEMTGNEIIGCNFLFFLRLIVAKRAQIFRRMGVNNYTEAYKQDNNLKRIVFVIDEFQSIRTGLKEVMGDDFDVIIKFLINVCRFYGITIIIATQSFLKNEIGSVVRDGLKYVFFGKVDGIKNFDLTLSPEILDSIKDNTQFIFVEKTSGKIVKSPFFKLKYDVDKVTEKKKEKNLVKSIMLNSIGVDSFFFNNLSEIFDFFNINDLKDKLKNSQYFFLVVYLLGKIYKQLKRAERIAFETLPNFDLSYDNWEGGSDSFDDNYEKIYFGMLSNKKVLVNRILTDLQTEAKKYKNKEEIDEYLDMIKKTIRNGLLRLV